VQPRQRFYSLDGLRVHALDWGGTGSPIVLLHGLASQARIWDLVAPRLAKRARVMAFDQRGHGLTDKPDDGYDFASVTRDLDGFLRVTRLERSVLAGHSWGANVALDYAARYPDRVAGLVFVDGGFLEIGSRLDWPAAEKRLEPPDLAGMPLTALDANLRVWLGSVWSDATAEIVKQNFEQMPDATIRPHLSKANHMQVVRALWEHHPSQLYARIRCPVLMIPAIPPGPHDAMTLALIADKRQAVELAEQRLARSRTIWMPDTLHDVPLHRPAELGQAMEEFLGEAA